MKSVVIAQARLVYSARRNTRRMWRESHKPTGSDGIASEVCGIAAALDRSEAGTGQKPVSRETG
jgi:hypothetical protein